jgi:hypothetical protein
LCRRFLVAMKPSWSMCGCSGWGKSWAIPPMTVSFE